MIIFDKYLQRLKILVFISLCLAFLASCSDLDDPLPPEPVEASRTVLVYMLAASNYLGDKEPDDYDMQDIEEMKQAAAAGDLADGRLIIFHSPTIGDNVLVEITPRGVDTLKIYDSTDVPQSSKRMSEVIDDMKRFAPAADYGLILWGHGSGWIQDGINEKETPVQGYSYGSELYNRRTMNVTTLARTIAGRGFSFLYMDCCYMSSVEVIYQLRNAVPRIVAYPTEVLVFGMPYELNVKHFFTPEPGLAEAARNTFDYYQAQPDYHYRMCTVAVLNTAGMERLAKATRAVYMRNSTGIPAGYVPQKYTDSSVCYFFDFGSYVHALSSDNELIAEFDAALDDVVELELATDRIWGTLDINEHSGLSTFIMKSDADANSSNYWQLDWFADVASVLIKTDN